MANLGNIFDFMNDPDKDKYDGSQKGPQIRPPRKPLILYYLIVLIVMALINTVLLPSLKQRSIEKASYNTFLQELENSNIELAQDIIDRSQLVDRGYLSR